MSYKYAILLGDGMAISQFQGGKYYSVAYAKTPTWTRLHNGHTGLVAVPAGMHPGSDVANLPVRL